MSSERGAPLELRVVSPTTPPGAPPVTVRMATCKGNVLPDVTSMLTPARVPVCPAVKVCATNLQHSLIVAPKLVGEVKDWSSVALVASVGVGVGVGVRVGVGVGVAVGVGVSGKFTANFRFSDCTGE